VGIVWIASYPKSGNTWVRFLVHHLLFGPAESSSLINERIPPILKNRSFEVPDGRFVCSKTHFVFGPNHPRASETARAIVIVRDPRDVAMSALNYRRLAGVLPPGVSDADYLRLFIQHRGDPEFAKLGFGTWASNVASWSSGLAFPTLALRYEQMKADPFEQTRAIASFLQLDVDDRAIAVAVDASGIDTLRALEVEERGRRDAGTIFKGRASNRFFMNKGATGQRLDAVEQGLDEAFEKAFGDDAERFGYTRS